MIVRAAALLSICALLAMPGHSRSSAAFDHGVVVGEWGAFKSSWLGDDWYQYLRISEASGGVFAYAYGGEPLVFSFRAEDVARSDGFVTVTLRRAADAPFRLVLSGWKIDGSSLVTGSLFMYRMRDGREALFNTISVRLTPLEEGVEPAPRIRHLRGR